MYNKNKNWRKKSTVFLITLVLAFFVSGASVTSAVGESQEPKDCPVSQRFQNWGGFLQSMIAYEDFTESFKDIFVRNFCHQYDIDILLRKMDKARKQIRNAFYTCKNAKVTQLVATYREMYVELFYLRSFLKYEGGDVTYDNTVQSGLVQMFVNDKKWYGLDDFLEMYGSFEAKYNADKYIYCEDDVWAELSDKWEEFKEVFADAGKNFVSKGMKDRWKKIGTTPPGKTGDFWSGRVGFYLNDVPPEYGESFFSGLFSEEELKNISEEVLNNLPKTGIPEEARKQLQGISNKEVSTSQLLESMQAERTRHLDDVSIARMIAEYTFLYKDASESIIDQLTEKLADTYVMEDEKNRAKDDSGHDIPNGLTAIIRTTSNPVLEEVKACSTQIRDKQCKN